MIRTLFRDFLAQRITMKLVLLAGWLCVVVMTLALLSPFLDALVATAHL